MKRKAKIEGMKKCANSHESCAISHTQHNANVKKGFLLGKPLMKNPYANSASISTFAIIWSLYIPSFIPNVVIIVGIILLRVPVTLLNALIRFCILRNSSLSRLYKSSQYLTSQRLMVLSARSIMTSICAPFST